VRCRSSASGSAGMLEAFRVCSAQQQASKAARSSWVSLQAIYTFVLPKQQCDTGPPQKQ
jgi:hypothetical protein